MNFIRSIPPHEQKKIALWHRISILFFLSMFFIILGIHAWQLYNIFVLKKEYTHLMQTNKHYSASFSEHQQLTQQHEKLSRYCQEATQIIKKLEMTIAFLQALYSSITPPATLSSCSLHENTFNTTIHCPTLETGISLARSLAQQTGIKHLKITSAQPSTHNTTIIMLQGTLALPHAASLLNP